MFLKSLWTVISRFILAAIVFSFTSCLNSKQAVYFNNIPDTVLNNTAAAPEPIIKKSDLLNITVSSLNPEASIIFNTPNISAGLNNTTMAAGSGGTVGAPQYTGYLVNSDGQIKFPVLGNIQAEGSTKKRLESVIDSLLLAKKLLIDPIVSIRFLNFRVTVIGEVARPTTINVNNDKISLLEALGLAGDMTVYGKRDNILLIREDGQKKVIKRINLNSNELLTSPYYYLQANDVVYVEARKEKVLNTSRTQQLLPIIISALSFAAIIASYYLKK